MKTNAVKNKTRLGLPATSKKRLHGDRLMGSYNIVKAGIAKNLYLLGVPIKVICREVYICKSTLYNYLKKEGVDVNSYIRGGAKLVHVHS